MAKKGKKAQEQQPTKAAKSPAQIVADKIRYHRDLDSRFVVIKETRVEYFRAKDFAELLSKHPELAKAITAEYDPEDIESIPLDELVGEELLRAKIITRCERVRKTLRPGKKKMSHWPGKLTFHENQIFTTNDGFYAWMYERQSPIWQTILSFLLPLFTVGCCLFPIFPSWAKLAVLYLLLALISSLFLILILRWLVFVAIWLVTGKRVWFFPSILAEEGTLAELFRFWPDKDDQPPAKLTTRAAVAVMMAFTMWLMVAYAPDRDTRAKYRKQVVNIIDEVLQWSPQMIAGNVTANGTAAFNSSGNSSVGNHSASNGTASDGSFSEGSDGVKGGSGKQKGSKKREGSTTTAGESRGKAGGAANSGAGSGGADGEL